ncbi:hypothetical protein [Labilithrix luteola]|uniref:hypothetical protein n=1 Tax=Labilithrix luteola TaxID=1391654 RepID=UPI0011BA68B2|nr:hypothetical protein [Labilithrix luteola]
MGLALAFGVTTPKVVFAQNAKVEAAAKALQKKAMEEDYLTTEFAKAQDKLDKAIKECGTDKCSAPVRAQLRRDLGVVQIGGQLDREKGIQNFVEALKLDPSTALDPDLKTKELDSAFAEAKKRAAGGAPSAPPATPTHGGGAATGGATGAATGTTEGQPQGDFTHTPAPEQQYRTPIPVYAEYAGEEQLVKVIVRYKGFGMTEWKAYELKKTGEKGWGGLLPCGDVQQGVTQYYIQGFNAENDPVATGGDRARPYKVPVKREKVANPPHLPGEAPPTQCQDTGDCPPDFPGCKKAAGIGGTKETTQEFIGKGGGEFCEEDSECHSGTCQDNKCTEPEGPKKTPKIWVGIWGAFDYSFLPSADDVCKLSGTREGQLPINDKNYYCVQDGNDYPFRQIPQQNNPRNGENAAILPGTSDKVSGGGAFGNIRIMASLDYGLTNNWMVGARLGYVFNNYPGQAAKDDGKTFAPIHLELRGTYYFGKDGYTAKLAPYAFAGGGVSTFDAHVKVTVVEQEGGPGAGGPKTQKEVDAWNISGPGFLVFGGGARFALNHRMALSGGLRLNLAFGQSFMPSIGPELGFLVGF